MRTIGRDQALREIRGAVLQLVDDDHSVCEVASRLGILCQGFRQFTDLELSKRYRWLEERLGTSGRAELEDAANRWQLARQLVQDERLSCDVQAKERDTCRGWTGFDDATIGQWHQQLFGEPIGIADAIADATGR